jgi:citronellyl-CoA dehydrogenase
MRAKGVTVTPLEQLGWHCSDTCEVAFNDVFLPTQALIGRPGMALPYVMHCMQLERVAAALLAIGGIEHCLQLVSRYTKGRMMKDGALADYQTVRHTFAGLVTELEAARQLAYHSAWLLQAGVSAVAQSAMAKLKATELAVEVARQAMQLHGAHGFQANTEVARIARDAFAATMAAGASEVMRDLIAVCALDDANLGAAPPA